MIQYISQYYISQFFKAELNFTSLKISWILALSIWSIIHYRGWHSASKFEPSNIIYWLTEGWWLQSPCPHLAQWHFLPLQLGTTDRSHAIFVQCSGYWVLRPTTHSSKTFIPGVTAKWGLHGNFRDKGNFLFTNFSLLMLNNAIVEFSITLGPTILSWVDSKHWTDTFDIEIPDLGKRRLDTTSRQLTWIFERIF